MCVFGAMVRGELVDREYLLFNDTFLTPDHNGWPSFTRDHMQRTIDVCRQCHRAIHALVPDAKELGWHHNTPQLLLGDARIAAFVDEPSNGLIVSRQMRFAIMKESARPDPG